MSNRMKVRKTHKLNQFRNVAAQVRPLVAYRLILCQLFAQDLTYFCLGADSIILVYSINTLLVTVLKHIRAI